MQETGGEAGIRTLGRTLKALQRFSKPPPSASRPPHRASASIRDKDTRRARTAKRDGNTRSGPLDANCNHKNGLARLFRRLASPHHDPTGHLRVDRAEVLVRPRRNKAMGEMFVGIEHRGVELMAG